MLHRILVLILASKIEALTILQPFIPGAGGYGARLIQERIPMTTYQILPKGVVTDS